MRNSGGFARTQRYRRLNRPAKDIRPDGGDIGAGQRVGTNNVNPLEEKRFACLLTANKLDGRDLAEITRVDHGEAFIADWHRIDTVTEHHVLHRVIVVDEVCWAQDGGVEVHLLEHALDTELAGEVRYVHIDVAVDHRQIDDPLDPGLTRKVEGVAPG